MRPNSPAALLPSASCPNWWAAQSQVERSVLPTLNQMIHDQIGQQAAPESQAAMVQRYREQIVQEQGES